MANLFKIKQLCALWGRCFIIAALVLFWAGVFWWVYPFISDDALISMRYSLRLAQGLGLTWNQGYPVEGFTNLLWVLINGFFMLFVKDALISTRVLGWLFALASVVLVVWRHPNYAWVFLGWICVASLPIWLSGGLEQGLLFFLVVGATTSAHKLVKAAHKGQLAFANTVWAGMWYPFLFATRPDAGLLLLVPGLLLAWLVFEKKSWHQLKPLLGYALPLVVGVAAISLFRWFYFGAWVPNTALVKVTGSNYHIGLGLQYVATGLGVRVVLLALIVFLAIRHQKHLHLWPLASGLLWLGWVAYSGGDIFPGYRHFVPFDALLGLALGGVVPAHIHLKKHQVAALVALVLFSWGVQYAMPENHRARHERWEYCGLQLGHNLGHAFGQQTLALNTAGCIPYAAKQAQMPIIDMLGLNNKTIAQTGAGEAASSTPAHGHANGSYVFDQQPHWVLMGVLGDSTPAFNSDQQLYHHLQFKKSYQPVRFFVPTKPQNPCEANGFYAILFTNKNKNTPIYVKDQNLHLRTWMFQPVDNNSGQITTHLPSCAPITTHFAEGTYKINFPKAVHTHKNQIHLLLSRHFDKVTIHNNTIECLLHQKAVLPRKLKIDLP